MEFREYYLIFECASRRIRRTLELASGEKIHISIESTHFVQILQIDWLTHRLNSTYARRVFTLLLAIRSKRSSSRMRYQCSQRDTPPKRKWEKTIQEFVFEYNRHAHSGKLTMNAVNGVQAGSIQTDHKHHGPPLPMESSISAHDLTSFDVHFFYK